MPPHFLACSSVRPVFSDDGPPKEPEKTQDAEKEDERPAKVSYKDNAATFESDRLVIALANRVQFRFTDEFPDDSVRLSGTAAAGDSRAAFRVRRAKTSLSGWFWRPEFKFDLQLSWAGPEAGASAQTALEDALITWDVSKKEEFQITFGQFKVPLGRQEMTSSSRMQFVDRDIFSFEFTRGRDLGLELNGVVAKDRLSYMVGVFNGNAASRLGNDNSKFQYNARVDVRALGSRRLLRGRLRVEGQAAFRGGRPVRAEQSGLHLECRRQPRHHGLGRRRRLQVQGVLGVG